MLKYDCKFFNGDKPCRNNKLFEIMCSDCKDFQPTMYKILIVKLDAIGDVLRTTSILQPLKTKYPDSHITWLTRNNAKDLFNGNLLVDEILTLDVEAAYRLNSEYFDIVINLDNSKLSSSIASSIRSDSKIGFILDPKGFVRPTNSEADYWLHLSAFDNLKKTNTRTYQEIMYDIVGLDFPVCRPILAIDNANSISKEQLINNLQLDPSKKTIGVNIGVGPKWPNKGWSLNKWEELIQLLSNRNLNILLLVGPDEEKLNELLLEKYPYLKSSGCSNSLIQFAEIINICDVVVTCDSLALHICTALLKKCVVLFGPTSSDEIELFNDGIKIKSDEECKCFYNRHCTEKVSCMEKIPVEIVLQSALNFLKY